VDTSGVNFLIRESLLPKSRLNILPYVVFRGTRHIDGPLFKEKYWPKFEGGNIIETKRGGVLLQVSINDFSKNEDAVNISYIYSRSARRDGQLHRPDREVQQATDISGIFFQEVIKLGELEQSFKDALDREKMRGDRILHWPIRDILVPLDDLKSLAEKGVLIIGDAGHETPILGGEGANSAVSDTVELADWISGRRVDGVSGIYEKRFEEWENEIDESEESLAGMHSVWRSSL
jgi:2-polyprenyl-6-methoxyphenol hydroxylase-like FAD-dependent oxidoreductase